MDAEQLTKHSGISPTPNAIRRFTYTQCAPRILMIVAKSDVLNTIDAIHAFNRDIITFLAIRAIFPFASLFSSRFLRLSSAGMLCACLSTYCGEGSCY